MELKGKTYVALVQGSEMSAGLHSRNLMLDINCCRISTVTANLWPNG